MAQIYFMGGEPADFIPFGNVSWNGFGDAYRRGWLDVSDGALPMGNRWYAPLTQTVTSFYYSQKVAINVRPTGSIYNYPFVAFYSGGVPVFGLGFTNSAGVNNGQLNNLTVLTAKNGVWSIAYTCPQDNSFVNEAKFDYKVDMATGQISAWTAGVPMFETTVDMAADSIDALALGGHSGFYSLLHAEIMMAAFDLRACRLKTLAPVAAVAGGQWSGTADDVVDVDYRNSASAVTTNTGNAVSEYTVSSLPSGTFSPKAVKVSGVFARGSQGPGSVMLGLDTGTGAPAYMGTDTVDEGPTWIRRIAETNPLDATPFSQEQIANLKIAIKSKL